MNLDSCVYLGNDLNDVSMFSNGIDDNDFIVVASHEKKEITNMIVKYLQSEAQIKGINWEKAKVLVLEDENVNNFLGKMTRVLRRVTSIINSKEDIRSRYKIDLKTKIDGTPEKPSSKRGKKNEYR